MVRLELESPADLAADRACGAAPDWPLPVAEADGEDWSGVIGGCHALRPAADALPPLPADAEDWGYGQVAC